MDEIKKHERQIEKTLKWAEGQTPLAGANGDSEAAKCSAPTPDGPNHEGEAVKDSQAEPLDPEVVDPMEGAIPGQSVAPVFTNRVGRPTKFFPQYIEQAKVLSSKGFTDLDLAQAFMVQESTIYLWKKDNQEFSEAIKAGKEMIDDEVEKSLLQSAMGYSHPETKVFCNEGTITREETIKHYPPNSNAASLWLRNRRPGKWRDKHEIDFKVPFTIKMDDADADTL